VKIYFIASEVEPFAKTGGLADVAAALPKALGRLGHDVRVVLPLYRQVSRERFSLRPTSHTVTVTLGGEPLSAKVWEARLPGTEVPVYFLERAALFDRDGLYLDSAGDFPDNLARFSFFSQAALRLPAALKWKPDAVHGHDWQAALAFAHLAFGAARKDPLLSQAGTVCTVHNLAFQGLFPRTQWALTGLPESAFTMKGLEFYGQINCLKGGLISADLLTTVSPTYMKEIQTPEAGCGLDGVLRGRGRDLAGILNGIDPEEWNPGTDPHLTATYTADTPAGKSLCKLALQRAQRLPELHELVIGMIQRLAEQKGIDLFAQAAEELMALPLQIVVLGTGDAKYHAQLSALARKHPGKLAVNLAFDNALAHQIEAGADAFLMPSRFEPCGLNQMYSMRYGTVPIVRRVGGLADTVIDLTPKTNAAKTATGFIIEQHTAASLVGAVKRAMAAFGDHALWTSLMQAGMRADFSWDASARAYVRIYEQASGKRRRQTPVAA
jgi:starch synthase